MFYFVHNVRLMNRMMRMGMVKTHKTVTIVGRDGKPYPTRAFMPTDEGRERFLELMSR